MYLGSGPMEDATSQLLEQEAAEINKNNIIILIVLEIKPNGLCMDSCDCYATNLAKGNRTLGKSVGFSGYTQNEQLIIHVVVASYFI